MKENEEVEVMDEERRERGVRSELRGLVTVVAKYENEEEGEEGEDERRKKEKAQLNWRIS